MGFDRAKFRALVLYVIWKTGEVRDFGSTKLNKVLWFSDARAFETLGGPLTGETYVRQKYGPVPQHVREIILELIDEGLVRSWTEPHFEYEVRHYSAHEPPDTSIFNVDELSLVDWWIKHVAEDHTAVSISEKSHDYGWKIAPMGSIIPYKAFLAKRIRLPKEGDELDWALAAAKELAAK